MQSAPALPLLKPIQVSESEEVTQDSPMSLSRREAKRDKKRRDEQKRTEPLREDWDLTQSRTPSKEVRCNALRNPLTAHTHTALTQIHVHESVHTVCMLRGVMYTPTTRLGTNAP